MPHGIFIAAVDENWGIAKDHKIPWHYPEDFKFFKERTKNLYCVMGYNTYKEISEMRGYPHRNGELLPGRNCMVLTSHDIPTNNHVTKLSHLETLSIYSYSFAFIGGTSIYDYAMGENSFNCGMNYGYITRIKKDYGCNMFFNHELLEKNYELGMVVAETDELRFEKWIRKTECD